MQIEAIRSFIILCQELNITKASEKLHMTQQGLSRQLKALKNEINIQLFTRSSKGLVLTAEGELLRPHFKAIIEHYEKGIKEIMDYQKMNNHHLKLAICPGIKKALGLNFFLQFQRLYPNIRIDMEFCSDMLCEEKLLNSEVDAAFLDWPVHKNEFNNYLLVKSHLVAVVRKDHPFASYKSVSMHDMKGQHVFIPDKSHRMHQRFAAHWPDIYHH